MVTAAPRLSSTVLEYLKRDLLLREGHFEYRSGRHTTALLDRDRLLADPEIASRMGYALAKAFFTSKIDTVATPSIWGAALAQWIAYFLQPRAKVVHATPTRGGVPHIADNLQPLIEGRRILLVDNLVVSGETLRQFGDAVEARGGEIIGIGTLWDLAEPDIEGHEVYGLLNQLYPAWIPEECPRCTEAHDDVEQIPY
jgi:orotate phosphoribosyltransferase